MTNRKMGNDAVSLYEERLKDRDAEHSRLMKEADRRLKGAKQKLRSAQMLYDERTKNT